MLESKLINILKTLTAEEFRDFEKFVSSPYFSKGRDLTPLYKALKPFYPEFRDTNLTVEFLFKKIFPAKKFESQKSYNVIKTLSSQLFKMCKDFLMQLEFEDDGKGKAYYLLNQLRKRKMYKEFDKDHEQLLSEQNNSDKGNVKDFTKDFLIGSVIADNFLDQDGFDNALENFFLKSEYIVAAGLISSFKFEDEKNIADVYNKPLRFTLMNSILENLDADKLMSELENNRGRFYPYVKVYYMIYRMNKYKAKTEYYFETKDLLEKSSGLFGQSENHELWNTMLTYCNIKIFTEEDEMFRKEQHAIHKRMLELNTYKRSAKEDFHIVLFRNILVSAAPLKEYDWIEKFINEYSSDLHPDHREGMKNYSHAYLNFIKEDFEKALEYIMKIRFDLFLYKHDTKMLQIKIYYELNYFEEALSLIDTLQHYFKSTKNLPDIHKAGFGSFLAHMKELCKIRNGGKIDLKQLEYFEHKIDLDSRYSHRWLKEKVKELKKSV